MICCVFYFLYINYSYDQLQYIANFSFFIMIMICIWTIYKTIKIIPKYQDGRISAKPKLFRMSRSKRRKENLKNSSKKKRVAAKVAANTPKGGTLGSDGILRHNGKEYVARNFDLTGNKVIYEQVINKKGTGNFKTTNDKGYFITVSKPKQIHEGVNYHFGNLIYDPNIIKSVDFIEGYLPGIPVPTKAGIGGWLAYQTLHPEEFYDGVITNYYVIKSTFVGKDKHE